MAAFLASWIAAISEVARRLDWPLAEGPPPNVGQSTSLRPLQLLLYFRFLHLQLNTPMLYRMAGFKCILSRSSVLEGDESPGSIQAGLLPSGQRNDCAKTGEKLCER